MKEARILLLIALLCLQYHRLASYYVCYTPRFLTNKRLPLFQRKDRDSTPCPNHFQDIHLLSILQPNCRLVKESSSGPPSKGILPLTIGLVLKSYQGCRRIARRNLISTPTSILYNDDSKCISHNRDSESYRIYEVVMHYVTEGDKKILEEHFPPDKLYQTAIELTRKSLAISPELVWEYFLHPLHPYGADNQLVFNPDFLIKLKSFHESVERPEGTYDIHNDEMITSLASLPRQACPGCGKMSQVYCGDCLGMRMPNAESLLPPPFPLPFDVLLILHWYVLKLNHVAIMCCFVVLFF